MPHQTITRLTVLLLVALIIQACGTTPPGGGGGQGGTELSLASVPGAAFQPPIGAAELLTGQFDSDLDVSLAAFLMRDGTPEGSPVGAILSADNGGVTLYNDAAREYYEALWKPSDAGVGAGTVLRLEARLPNAPADAPACVAEPDLLEGCIAYVDVQVRQDDVLIGQSGAKALPVALLGGALPVRVHVQQGTLEMKRVSLGGQHVTVEFDSGASVGFPPVESGAGAVVDVLLLGNGPHEELSLIEWASDTVALQFHSAVTWQETATVQVRLPLRSEALQSQDVWEIGNTVIVNVRRARSAAVGAAKDVAIFGYRALSAGGQVVLDAYMWEIEALGDAIGAGIHTVTYTVPKSLKNWRDTFKPPIEGLFGVRTKYIPTVSEAASNGCTFDLINAGLAFQHLPNPRTPWSSTADTAVVMVHGWQTLGGILQGGDVLGKAAHCRTWIDLMAAYTHRGGEWSTLREGTDLFTFRYDSDHRIALSGNKLKEAVTQLQTRGYRNVILLGHSMGGLVSIQARQQLPDPKFVSGIVTLATPFMGGAPVCTATAHQTIDGISQEYCAILVAPTDENLAILLEYVDLGDGSMLDGTLDLASYYGSTIVTAEPNPYLVRLWSDSSNFQDVTALYGDSSLPGRSADTFYAPLIAATRVLGGPNDGAVAIASAVAASSFTTNRSQALALSQLSSATPAGFARDHGQMTNGCRNCTDGRNGNPGAYDPYFNYVASAVASHLIPMNTAPGALTLQPGEPYCTLEGSPAIRLTWSASAGAIGYEIYRDGEFFVGNLTTQTSFDNDANVTPGATYSYFVRAVNSAGTTDSNTQTVTAAVEGCEVEPVEGADLVITELTVTPNAAEPGSVVTITFNVTNQGDAPSAASVTRIRITNDATDVTTSDPLLAELNTPPLPATESLAYTQIVTLPAELVDGDYFLWVIADVFNHGEQSNYDNDRASTPLSVRTPFEACTAGDPNDASNPCQLTSIEQVQAISANLDGHYALGGSINATATATWNAGSGFQPIGSQDRPFTGTLDGRGFEIVGLTIDREDTSPVGLFAVVGSAGLIRDINLVGGAISGLGPVGAAAGLNRGTLQEIQQSNSVYGHDRVGGLVGLNTGQISGATNFGAVEGSSLVGGIVGHNQAAGLVTEAQNAGSIQGETYVGGVVGLSEGGSITGATNTAQVIGENTVGGILGLGEEGVELTEARNTGTVNGGDNTGGIAGLHSGSIAASSNSGSVTGNDYVGGLSGLSGVGPISNSNNTGHVIGREYVGGLTGLSGTGPITTSFNSGPVNGEVYVGGVAGLSQGNIENTYNAGRLDGTSNVGGITSILAADAVVVHVFSVGPVLASESAGAIVAVDTAPERLLGAHFDSNTTGRPESDAGNGWATAQMYQQSTYSGWDFQSVWSLQEGVDYPDLISNPR